MKILIILCLLSANFCFPDVSDHYEQLKARARVINNEVNSSIISFTHTQLIVNEIYSNETVSVGDTITILQIGSKGVRLSHGDQYLHMEKGADVILSLRKKDDNYKINRIGGGYRVGFICNEIVYSSSCGVRGSELGKVKKSPEIANKGIQFQEFIEILSAPK